MIGSSFNAGWAFRPRVGPFEVPAGDGGFTAVTLPHDAMLGSGRSAQGDPALGYFSGGAFEYEKRFDVPADWAGKTVLVRFEGVYRDAVVAVNGGFAAHRPSGYAELAVRLDDVLEPGVENVLSVECRTGNDSRWYSGAGIYRDVTLFVADPVHVALDGIWVTTPVIDDDRAVLDVAVTVENDTTRRTTVDLRTEILDADGNLVASDLRPLTVDARADATVRARVVVDSPARWSTEAPHLHTCRVVVERAGGEVDVATATFGIRSLTVDAERGLRINGESIKLRGACIHHDNGVLGAATIGRADERRVEVLKAAGFNAIRSAHNPISRAMLEACDRHGVLVMDEAFDMWHEAKRDQDYAMHFPTWWERDLDAMVVKDRNHPSVILYSIGNEIAELAVPAGAAQARAMVERVRALDPTRPVTNGINLLLPFFAEIAQTGQLNALLGGADQEALITSDLVTEGTAESFAALDVAGYNYGEARYEADRERFPNRVIVGSETFPRQIDKLWRLVLDNDHVIGDFTWTGWDYLGEAGIGRVEYETDPASDGGFAGPYPWRTAACADIDITGRRLPVSYYREIVFGLRTDPYVAVRPPAHHGARRRHATPWSWSTATDSWTWDGDEGRTATVEVYACAPEVELWQDGRLLERRAAGEANRYRATFEVTYEPGELTAVAYDGATEVGRTSLRSAVGDLHVTVSVDRRTITARHDDLAFVSIELVDERGTVHPGADRTVQVTVEGPAVLQGLGTAAPASEDDFLADTCMTYQGRATAVVRPTGAGEVVVSVDVEGLADRTVTFHATAR